jgi:hypothetical protein
MIRLTAAAVAITALAAGTLSAQACNPLLNNSFGKHVSSMSLPASMLARNDAKTPARTSIVGLWHVVHTDSSGNLFLESFDQWNSDGGETELGNLPPATGPICVGTWKQTGGKVDLETHVTWLYDLNNTWQGTLNMIQTNKVSKDGNSYTGTFDAKFYDTSGTLFMEVTGTTAADRLVSE